MQPDFCTAAEFMSVLVSGWEVHPMTRPACLLEAHYQVLFTIPLTKSLSPLSGSSKLCSRIKNALANLMTL